MTRRTDEARILRGLNDMAAIEDLFAQSSQCAGARTMKPAMQSSATHMENDERNRPSSHYLFTLSQD
jgi:hypothetical protein